MTQTRIISNRSKAEVQCDSSGAGVWSLCCGEGFDAFFQHGVRANGLEPGRSGSACFPLGMNIDACIPHITSYYHIMESALCMRCRIISSNSFTLPHPSTFLSLHSILWSGFSLRLQEAAGSPRASNRASKGCRNCVACVGSLDCHVSIVWHRLTA